MNPPVVLQDYIRMLEPDYRDPTDEERSEFMDKITSSDGPQIAFDRLGDGPPVIVVRIESAHCGDEDVVRDLFGQEIGPPMRLFGQFLHTLGSV